MHMQNYLFFITKEIYTLGKESAILALRIQYIFQKFLASFTSYLTDQLVDIIHRC